MQINHPGRVIPKDLADTTWAPAAVPIDIGGFSSMYPTPQPMTAQEIDETVERFAVTAQRAQQAGFDGVEIHAAHGYLLSQFLSPLVNRRDDRWGGSLHNRARLLLDVVGAVRERVGTGFAVGVKLNPADFQCGGFDTDDARDVIKMLADVGTDLVELSGGSIESMATAGSPADGRTLAREAYFLELAEQLVATSPLPLLLTGGIRRRAVAQQVIDSGVAMAGIATALAIDPTLPGQWLAGSDVQVRPPRTRFRNKMVASAAVQAVTSRQLARLGAGKPSKTPYSPAVALLLERLVRARRRRNYLKWHTAA
ncbi:2,4-dienoyl-CoA reductase [Streptomyces pseudovenezuelae]|uniref:2,4-dienoyl-CoA reductase-like NADH-dependent reductase (Old Yellow Enzyme family) n=1 Tax=Streptomyces pseudovenezuelae TaxID=67350 RepID=A0ABT6M0P6_9ACTN|nr:2,4-dienoyl-CoA reductase-like NADH-dependent reductase (Old Yellow Enzyme family) [Streptomyces pseudovenezuelae]